MSGSLNSTEGDNDEVNDGASTMQSQCEDEHSVKQQSGGNEEEEVAALDVEEVVEEEFVEEEVVEEEVVEEEGEAGEPLNCSSSDQVLVSPADSPSVGSSWSHANSTRSGSPPGNVSPPATPVATHFSPPASPTPATPVVIHVSPPASPAPATPVVNHVRPPATPTTATPVATHASPPASPTAKLTEACPPSPPPLPLSPRPPIAKVATPPPSPPPAAVSPKILHSPPASPPRPNTPPRAPSPKPSPHLQPPASPVVESSPKVVELPSDPPSSPSSTPSTSLMDFISLFSPSALQTQDWMDRSKDLWKSYLDRVRDYRAVLLAADEALSHLAFFAPSYGGETDARWIEVLFGFLQLNRLSMDLASAASDRDPNPFGASVAVDASQDFPARAARVALTVVQCLWPVAQELVKSRYAGPAANARRQARVRCVLERIRFCLRVVLLVQYWKQIRSHGEAASPGLLVEGGLYNGPGAVVDSPRSGGGPSDEPLSVEQEIARLKRAQYSGRRTGRRVGGSASGPRRVRSESPSLSDGEEAAAHPPPSPRDDGPVSSWFPAVLQPYVRPPTGIMVGELLYAARPLLQAEAQARTTNAWALYQVWALCLSMDVTSLLTLKESLRLSDGHPTHHPLVAANGAAAAVSSSATTPQDRLKAITADLCSPEVGGNGATQLEWKRRRLRLFLYLLRSPIWDRHTRGTAESVGRALERVPLLGGLLQNYLWDWLYYWKLYRAEEG